MSEEMKAVFEALLPQGAIWKPKPDGDFDRLLAGMGDNAQLLYDFNESLAHLRDPRRTASLADLEKEYGQLTNTALSEADRRKQLAGVKYAVPDTESWELMQDKLREAGFDNIVVTPNDPAINPDLITGELVVNGPVYTEQTTQYLAQANGDNMFAGNALAITGYFVNIARTPHAYEVNSIGGSARWPYWRFIFFVGGVASGWPSAPAIAIYPVDANREQLLKRLVLSYKPLRAWALLVIEYVYQFFADLIFANTTTRYFHNPLTDNVIGPFGSGVLAAVDIEDHRYAQFETASKNFLDVDPVDFTAWTIIGGASVTPNVIAAPDGTLTADRLTFGAPSTDGIKATISTVGDNQNITHSIFVRTESGTSILRLEFLRKDGTTATTSNIGVSTNWVRVDFLTDILSGATTPEVRILNRSGGGADTLVLWCSQPEESNFPTSPILGSLQVRNKDEGSFAAEDVAEQMRTGLHAIGWIPNAASTDTRPVQVIYKFEDGANFLQVVVTASNRILIEKFDGGWTTLVQTAIMTWAGLQFIEIAIDPEAGSVVVTCTGGDKVIGDEWRSFLSSAAVLFYGMDDQSDQQTCGKITQPYKKAA